MQIKIKYINGEIKHIKPLDLLNTSYIREAINKYIRNSFIKDTGTDGLLLESIKLRNLQNFYMHKDQNIYIDFYFSIPEHGNLNANGKELCISDIKDIDSDVGLIYGTNGFTLNSSEEELQKLNISYGVKLLIASTIIISYVEKDLISSINIDDELIFTRYNPYEKINDLLFLNKINQYEKYYFTNSERENDLLTKIYVLYQLLLFEKNRLNSMANNHDDISKLLNIKQNILEYIMKNQVMLVTKKSQLYKELLIKNNNEEIENNSITDDKNKNCNNNKKDNDEMKDNEQENPEDDEFQLEI